MVDGRQRLEIETTLAGETMLELSLLLLRGAYPAGSGRRIEPDVPGDVEHHATGDRLCLPTAAVGMPEKHRSRLVAARNRDAREAGADRAFGVEIEPGPLVIVRGGEHPGQLVGRRRASPRREAVPDPASGLEKPADLPVGDGRQIIRLSKHAGEHHLVTRDPPVGYRRGAVPIDAQLESTGQVPLLDTDQPRNARRGHASRHTRFGDEPPAGSRVGDVADYLELAGLRALPAGGVAQQRVDQSSRLPVLEVYRHPRPPFGGLPVQDRNRIVLRSDVPQIPDLIHDLRTEAVDRLLTQCARQVRAERFRKCVAVFDYSTEEAVLPQQCP